MINRAHFIQLLLKLATDRQDDFVGLGVIAYLASEGLPVFPLGIVPNTQPKLPVHGEKNVMHVLSELATRHNASHDGFHLIDANNGDLTHIAQFVSPPLDIARQNLRINWPNGARQMAALLVSAMPQVAFAAVVTAEGDVQLYVNGMQAMNVEAHE